MRDKTSKYRKAAMAGPWVVFGAAAVALINVFDDANSTLWWTIYMMLAATGVFLALWGNRGWRREIREEARRVDAQFEAELKCIRKGEGFFPRDEV